MLLTATCACTSKLSVQGSGQATSRRSRACKLTSAYGARAIWKALEDPPVLRLLLPNPSRPPGVPRAAATVGGTWLMRNLDSTAQATDRVSTLAVSPPMKRWASGLAVFWGRGQPHRPVLSRTDVGGDVGGQSLRSSIAHVAITRCNHRSLRRSLVQAHSADNRTSPTPRSHKDLLLRGTHTGTSPIPRSHMGGVLRGTHTGTCSCPRQCRGWKWRIHCWCLCTKGAAGPGCPLPRGLPLP